jgi:hypothetical protein
MWDLGCLAYSLEVSMTQEWCTHCKPGSMWYVGKGYYPDFPAWNFCPICGTPRPKDKTLEEKFEKHMRNDDWMLSDSIRQDAINLAKIATEHFKEIQ